MRIIVQRVSKASVEVDNILISEIGNGLLLLVGIEESDNKEDIDYLINKIINLRIFDDENGVMNKSLKDIDGEILSVSQFTLMASTKKGNRPSYIRAAKPLISIPLYEMFLSELSLNLEKKVKNGLFGAEMNVSLCNSGPVTIIIDSKQKGF